MIDFINSLLKKEKPTLTADQARNLLDFGRMEETLEMATVKEILEMERRIKDNSRFGRRVVVRTVSNNLLLVSKKLLEHFKKAGFITDLYENEEIKDYHIVIIGW